MIRARTISQTRRADRAAVAYQTAWLQEANDLMRVIESANFASSQRMQAQNNLNQLGSAIHNYNEQFNRSGQSQSEEGRKLSAAVQDFEAKQADLDRRIVVENKDGTTNFYVAKDQQQAARASAEQAKGNPNANADVFFDQLNSNGETFQRQVVTDNNRARCSTAIRQSSRMVRTATATECSIRVKTRNAMAC